MKTSRTMTRKEFNRQMRALGWTLVGPVALPPHVKARFIKWTKGDRTILVPDHDILNGHTAHKLLGEAEG